MNFSPIIKNREILLSTVPSENYDGREDFATWQTRAREVFKSVLGFGEFEKCDPDFSLEQTNEAENYLEYRFNIASENNYRFSAILRAPKTVKAKMPLMLIPAGHSEDVEAYLNDKSDSVSSRALAKGYCPVVYYVRNFDECFIARERVAEEMQTRTTWIACSRSSFRSFLLSRSTMGERVWDSICLINTLASEFDFLNTDSITVVACNGNASMAYYLACVDERITSTVISSGLSTWESSIGAKSLCVCTYIPTIANYFSMGGLGGLIAPRKLLCIGSSIDPYYTVSGLRTSFDEINALYSACGAEGACKMVTHDGTTSICNDVVWDSMLNF